MTTAQTTVIKDKADFLANAQFLAQESLEQYAQLADSLTLHHNPEAAAQVRELEAMERQQLQWLDTQAQGLELPHIAPWEFSWYQHYRDHTNSLSNIEYTTSPAEVLDAALRNERFTEWVYRQVAERTADPEVEEAALAMAELQVQQVRLLTRLLDELPPTARESIDDLDPPNVVG